MSKSFLQVKNEKKILKKSYTRLQKALIDHHISV